jgi:phage tail sheath protein FI
MARHGVTFRELPTSVISPIEATSGINVVIGTAPVHVKDDWARALNRPILCTSAADAQEYLGFSPNFDLYPLCEHMDSAFRQFGIGPVVYINVLDPDRHSAAGTPTTLTLVNGLVNTQNANIVLTTLVVTDPVDTTIVYERGVDFLTSYDSTLNLIITRISTGAIPADNSQIRIEFDAIDHSLIDEDDIIGGIDINTGRKEGIEVVELVFAETGLVPGILLAPSWSDRPAVAAVLETKASDINGCFKCRCCIDVADSITKVIDVLTWKTNNNIVSPRQDCAWPFLGLGERARYHLSSQWGPLQMHTDATRGGNIPYHSPSNKALKCNRTELSDGTEMILSKDQADYLNSIGVVTALNWGIYGWKGWGNRTAAGGGQSADVKDVFIPNKRMGDWIGNTFVLTMHAYVDEPGNRRLIDLVVNSFNRWLNGIQAQGAILGGRIEFRHEDNPTDQLLDGHYVFHVFYLSPTPAEWIEALLEVDIGYFDVLFDQAA